MDLELAGADRRLHPVPVAAGVRERLRDRRLARAVEAQHTASGRRAAGSTRRTGSVSSAFGHSRCSSAAGLAGRRPRRGRCRAPCPAPSRPGRARSRPRAGSPACGRRARSRRRAGSAARRPSVRPPRSPRAGPRRARARGRRPSRRARPSGRRASGRDRRRRGTGRPRGPSESAASSSSGRSPTIVILAGSRPSPSACAARNGPFRSVRSPRTSSLPVTTIAARGRAPRLGAGPGGDDVARGDDQATRLRHRRRPPSGRSASC